MHEPLLGLINLYWDPIDENPADAGMIGNTGIDVSPANRFVPMSKSSAPPFAARRFDSDADGNRRLVHEPLLGLINLYWDPIDENPADAGMIGNTGIDVSPANRFVPMSKSSAPPFAARGMHPRGELSTSLGERETDRGKNEGFKPEIIGKRPMDAKLRAEHNSSGFDLILEQQANGLGEFTPAQAAMSGSIWRKSVSP